MLGLSVRSPWSWFIVHANKRIENRDWRPELPAGGLEILIQQSLFGHLREGKHSLTRADQYEVVDDFKSGLKLWRRAGGNPDAFGKITPGMLLEHCGSIIARARIVDVVQYGSRIPLGQRAWFVGPYGFVLQDVVPTQPTPCKGALGFFTVPRDVVDRALGRRSAECAEGG